MRYSIYLILFLTICSNSITQQTELDEYRKSKASKKFIQMIDNLPNEWGMPFKFTYKYDTKTDPYKIVFAPNDCNTNNFDAIDYEDCLETDRNGIYGYCQIYIANAEIKWATIVIFVERIAEIYPDEYYKQINRVIVHEMGHCLGMDHTKDPKDIMNAFIVDYPDIVHPNEQEKETVKKVYITNNLEQSNKRFVWEQGRAIKLKNFKFAVNLDFGLIMKYE